MKKSGILIVICFLGIAFILYNSSQSGEASNKISRAVATITAHTVTNYEFQDNLSFPAKIKVLNLVIRKFAHTFEFMVLAILIVLTQRSLKVKGKRSIFYALAIILLVASLDEIFQLFIEGRTASVKDMFIDFSGGILGYTVCIGRKNAKSK